MAKLKKSPQREAIFLQKINKALTIKLFRSHFQQEDAHNAEDDVGYPCRQRRRQASRDGEGLGDLHKEDVGKRDGNADADMHSNAASHLTAR